MSTGSCGPTSHGSLTIAGTADPLFEESALPASGPTPYAGGSQSVRLRLTANRAWRSLEVFIPSSLWLGDESAQKWVSQNDTITDERDPP